MTEGDKFLRGYIEDHARRVYGMHIMAVEEVAAAFIARHGLEPADAQVVTRFDDKTMTWTTHVERKPRGGTQHPDRETSLPAMPDQWERPFGG